MDDKIVGTAFFTSIINIAHKSKFLVRAYNLYANGLIMAGRKELGQIHTVNHTFVFDGDNDLGQIDLSLALTEQLQRMVRQGNMFKVVGIDMTLTDYGGGDAGGQVSGWLDYYAPTRGRCEAYRDAFAALRNAMKLQGINMSDNKFFDFRASFADNSNYVSSNQLINLTTLDSSAPLALANGPSVTSDIFRVHNDNVAPTETVATATFPTGFNTMGVQNSPTNFVINEADSGYYGNENWASPNYESIPFQLSFTPGSTDVSVSFSWKPDPSLYLAIMCGLIQIRIDELDLDSGTSALTLTTAVHVAGWKSIMGNPDKKKKRSSRGRRRKSKK